MSLSTRNYSEEAMELVIQSLSDICSEPVEHLLQPAVERGISAYIYGAEQFELSKSQLLLLALMDGLSKEDIRLCQQLIGASHCLPQLNSPSLALWLRNDFSFDAEFVSNAQRQLQKLIRKGDLSVPGYVYSAIMFNEKQSSQHFYKRLSNVPSLSSRDVDSAYTSSESEDGTTDFKHLFEELSSNNDEDCFETNQLCATVEDNKAEVETSVIIAGEDCNKPSSIEQTFQEFADCKGINGALENKLEHEDNLTDKDEEEGLLREIRIKDTLAVKAFIQPWENVNVKYGTGNTPLHLAAYQGDEKIIRTLLDHGASVKMENDEGFTALHLASTGYAVYAIVSFGADINQKGSSDMTPLHLAVIEGNLEVVKALIVMEASMTEQDDNGDTALHIAARTDNMEILMELLKADSSLEVRNNSGETPLHIAASTENLDMVKELIVAGADIEAKDNQGYTVAFSAALNENHPMLLMLCNFKADLNAVDENESTIMHALVKTGSIEVIELLLAEGADFDWRDKSGRTPLHLAVECGDVCMAQALMSYGADVEAIGDNGYRPLHIAAAAGDKLIVGLLLDHGASVLARDLEGWTPLHHAAAGGDVGVMDQLLTQGACAKTSDIFGRQPLEVAKAAGRQEAVDHLVCLSQLDAGLPQLSSNLSLKDDPSFSLYESDSSSICER